MQARWFHCIFVLAHRRTQDKTSSEFFVISDSCYDHATLHKLVGLRLRPRPKKCHLENFVFWANMPLFLKHSSGIIWSKHHIQIRCMSSYPLHEKNVWKIHLLQEIHKHLSPCVGSKQKVCVYPLEVQFLLPLFFVEDYCLGKDVSSTIPHSRGSFFQMVFDFQGIWPKNNISPT